MTAFNATALLPSGWTREQRKIVLFVVLSFLCLGLPRVTTNATAFALFLDAFGAAMLPYTYLGAAVLAPLVGAGYLWLQRRVSFWTLILSALAFDIVALGLAWAGLQTPLAHGLIAALTVWVEVEWMIAGLVFWGLAERMFTLRDAKRLFGVISSGEPAAVIAGGFAIPLFLTVLGTTDLILVSAGAMAGAIGLIIAVRRRFGDDLAEGHGDEEEPSGFKVLGGFGRYQSYVNLVFLMVLLAEIAHFVVDNAFYDLAEHRYRDKEALASFIGVFFAASGVINLLCNVFVSGWVLRRHGVGAAMLSLPVLIIAAGSLAIAAFLLSGPGLGFFAMVALIKLIDEAVRNGIYTTGFLTVYQPLPPELRTRAHAASGSCIEQIAAGVAGLALLGLNLALGFGALELSAVAVLISLAWAWTARRQFLRYLDVLRQAVARRRLGSGGISLDDDGSLAVVEERLAGPDPGEAMYALNLIEAHAPQRLPGAVRALLAHPSADARREALCVAERAALAELFDDIDARLAAEGDDEVAAQALRALAAADEARAMERVLPYLGHSSPVLRGGAVIALMRYCGIDGTLAAGEAFKGLLGSRARDEQRVAGTMLEELASPQFFRPLIENITSEDRVAQRAGLRAARRVDAAQLRPVLLQALHSRHVGRAAAAALVNAGDAVLPELAALCDDRATASGTRGRIAWTLGRIGSPAAVALLFARLDAPDLDERFGVAQALGYARFIAGPGRSEKVWADIEAARATARLLDAGAALGGGQPGGRDERLEMLRAACREARARERERLFLLLAMVLPRERIQQVAWRLARGTDEERAYAMEVLDSLLPARRRSGVLELLDGKAAPLEAAGASPSAFLAHLGAQTPASAWIRCCALYAARAALPPEPAIRQWLHSPEPVLSGTARALLGETAQGETAMLTIEKVMILRSVPLFSGVPGQFLADIAEVLGKREVGPGEIVIHEGEMGDQLYVIVHGSFDVTHNGRSIARLGPRQVFGELAVLDPEPRAATVTAEGEGLLFTLEHEHLDDLMAGSMEIAHGFIRMLCRRVRETNTRAAPAAGSGIAA